MNIGLVVLAELLSMGFTGVVNVINVLNVVIDIAEDGYVLNRDKVMEVKENNKWIKNKEDKVINKLKTISFFIPVVNILVAALDNIGLKDRIIKEYKANDVLVELSEKDIEYFKSLKTKMQKILYITAQYDKKDGQEVIGFMGNTPLVVVDHDLSRLNYEKLLPLDYTLNEVKLLNNLTGYSYRAGTIDDENVAVIGIPNPNSTLKRVEYPNDNFITAHKYVKMDLEEAKDKTFTVYPFTYDGEIKRNLDVAVEEIKQKRLNNYNCEEVYTPQIEEFFEEVYNPTQSEVPLNEEVKTLKMIKTNKKK
jgi:hypothetical protein